MKRISKWHKIKQNIKVFCYSESHSCPREDKLSACTHFPLLNKKVLLGVAAWRARWTTLSCEKCCAVKFPDASPRLGKPLQCQLQLVLQSPCAFQGRFWSCWLLPEPMYTTQRLTETALEGGGGGGGKRQSLWQRASQATPSLPTGTRRWGFCFCSAPWGWTYMLSSWRASFLSSQLWTTSYPPSCRAQSLSANRIFSWSSRAEEHGLPMRCFAFISWVIKRTTRMTTAAPQTKVKANDQTPTSPQLAPKKCSKPEAHQESGMCYCWLITTGDRGLKPNVNTNYPVLLFCCVFVSPHRGNQYQTFSCPATCYPVTQRSVIFSKWPNLPSCHLQMSAYK